MKQEVVEEPNTLPVDWQLDEVADIPPEHLIPLARTFNYPDFWMSMLEWEYWYWEPAEFYGVVEKA